MKAILSGDAHLSNRVINGKPRLPVCMQFMQDLIKLAQLHDVRHVFLAGDTWDAKHNTPREVLTALYRFLWQVKQQTKITVHLIRGNHETPIRSAPQDTFMRLFSEVADVVLTTKVVEIEDVIWFLISWHEENTLIKLYENAAAMALKYADRKTIMVTHVGVREGRVSASNIQIPQRVSITHLHPDLYDLVVMGDYHAHQFVTPNAFYVGAPIPHTFGDEKIVGPWLVDTSAADGVALEPLVLPHRPPAFCRWTVTGPDSMPLPGYRSDDYNRIACDPRFVESVRLRYPDAEVRLLDGCLTGESEGAPDLSSSRVSQADMSDPGKVVDRYLKFVAAKEEEIPVLREIAMTCLSEASKL